MKTKVMISIVHGRGVWYYVLPENIHGGPNTVRQRHSIVCLSSLTQAIECIQRTLKAVEDRDGKLPGTFYFQADNCFRESKNTYQLAYFCLLVQRLVFKTIYLSFHPKGHTHNECDQCASRISMAVRNEPVLCRCQFTRILASSFTPQPTVVYLDQVADIKTMFNPSGEGSFPKGQGYNDKDEDFKASHVHRATGINKSHLFKIQCDRCAFYTRFS